MVTKEGKRNAPEGLNLQENERNPQERLTGFQKKKAQKKVKNWSRMDNEAWKSGSEE